MHDLKISGGLLFAALTGCSGPGASVKARLMP